MKRRGISILLAGTLFICCLSVVKQDVYSHYPVPEMIFYEEKITLPMEGIDRTYRIAWISDLHLINNLEPANDVKADYMDAIKQRYSLFVAYNGYHTNELWPRMVDFVNYKNYDAVVLGGDIMDYCSEKNMDCFLQSFNRLNPEVPVMYIRSDHDYGFYYGGKDFKEPDAWNMHVLKVLDNDANNSRVIEFDKFMIIGINKSTKNMSKADYNWFLSNYNRAVATGKKIIIATHVPYESKVDSTLENISMSFRNKKYYWGGPDYLPDKVTSDYFNLIYAYNSPVVQVLSGHMHMSWGGKINEKVSEYVFAPGFLGVVGVIEIVPVNNLK